MTINQKLDQVKTLISEIEREVNINKLNNTPVKLITSETLKSKVIECFGILESDLTSNNINREITDSRKAFCFLMNKYVTQNKSQISKMLNKKSHKSAKQLIDKAEGLMITDKIFKEKIKYIESLL